MRSIKIVLLLTLIFSSCKTAVKEINKRSDIIKVVAVKPQYLEFRDPVRSSGILATRTEVKLSFKTGGLISTMNVREGQTVDEGDILASLDLSEIKAQVSQAEIAYEKTKRDYYRALNLYRDSVATLETLQNAKSAYDLSKAQKRIVDFNLQHSRIVAPSQGKILKIIAEKNEMIAPGYPVILFATTENDWIVRVSLADKDIVKFDTGDSASIQMDAFHDRIFSAEISELGSVSDPVTGTYDVELVLKEDDPDFRTGYIARVSLFPNDSIKAWWIPFEAVQNLDNNRGHVFVVDSMTARKTNVRTGTTINEGILILEGLSGSDLIITEGAGYLKDGSEINVVPSKSIEK